MKKYIIFLILFLLLILLFLVLFIFKGQPKSIVVKQSGGAGILIQECSDKSYITKTSDYIIEGTIEKVESSWNTEKTLIFTYSDLKIEKYVKGTPFTENKLQIVTPGGKVGEVGQWVEDQPIFYQGKKVRIYFQETNGEFSIVCSQMGVEEINPVDSSIQETYKNSTYGFEIILPNSWRGYSILAETWNGQTLDEKATKYQGPKVTIRNPNWTETKPWQDIPIMVFTKDEWKLIEAENLGVSAAPIGPSKLDENQNYVFALPPRWVGFTDALGQDEAVKITETFKAF